MTHFTSNTYQLKRKILNFANKISRKLTKPNRKFTANMTYGILASQSCLLTDTDDHLHEPSKKVNVVDRLSRHLKKGTPPLAAAAYFQQVKQYILIISLKYTPISIKMKICSNLAIPSGCKNGPALS